MIFLRLTGSFRLFLKYVCSAFSVPGFRLDVERTGGIRSDGWLSIQIRIASDDNQIWWSSCPDFFLWATSNFGDPNDGTGFPDDCPWSYDQKSGICAGKLGPHQTQHRRRPWDPGQDLPALLNRTGHAPPAEPEFGRARISEIHVLTVCCITPNFSARADSVHMHSGSDAAISRAMCFLSEALKRSPWLILLLIQELDGNKMGRTCKRFAEKGR